MFNELEKRLEKVIDILEAARERRERFSEEFDEYLAHQEELIQTTKDLWLDISCGPGDVFRIIKEVDVLGWLHKKQNELTLIEESVNLSREEQTRVNNLVVLQSAHTPCVCS